MKTPSYKPRTSVAALMALTLALTTVVANFSAVYAATLSTASLSLQDSRPSVTSQYTLAANGFSTGTSIGCIEVDLGTASNGSGAITGLNTASASFVSQTVTASGTWAADNTANADHKLRLTNATPVAPQTGSQTAVFGAVTNGSVVNTAYYAVITTYTTSACTTPVDTTTVQFIYTNGQAVTASVDGTLSFTVAGVANGDTSIAGVTPNVTSTNGTLPFGTITTGTNPIAAQDLTITTNAGNGYTVYTSYTGPMTNGNRNFTNQTGSNASPAAFPSAGTAEAFGYTTTDTSLTGGNRFSSATLWAPFSTTNSEVVYGAPGASTETARIGIQASISGTTPPGAYATTVIYTATPTY